MELQQISEVLKLVDISKKECDIYISLLKNGASTVAEVTRIVKHPRTTVVENLAKLMARGLVSMTMLQSGKKYVAEDPKVLQKILTEKNESAKEQVKKYQNVSKSMGELVQSIKDLVMVGEKNQNFNVKFFQGSKYFKRIYAQALTCEEYYSFVDLDKYYTTFPDTQRFWNKAMVDNPKRKVYDIVVESTLAKKISNANIEGYDRYFTKFIPPQVGIGNFELAAFDNSLLLVQLDPTDVFAVTIESGFLSNGIKTIHQTLWNLL